MLWACVTDQDREKFEQLNSKPHYITIPAGIDLDTWKFSPTYSYHNWYHLGSMEWHANKEAVSWFAHDIYPALRKNYNIKLHLGGKGIKAGEFADDIVIAKQVPDAFEFVRTKDVCIVPLLSGSGIRVKILEAMAAGKLVISTRVGAQGIDARNGKEILIADSSEEFEQILQSLRSGDCDITAIVDNARKLVEEIYSINAAANELLSAFEKAIR